jgi:protein phosphatase
MPRITCAGLTHQGRVRTQNEDRWTADPRQGLFIVSDGMGGQHAGALAARIVVETLPALLCTQMQGIDDLTTPEVMHRLLTALATLSEQVHRGSQGQPGLDGMGATVVLALLRGTQALIAHMGDSRAYLVRRTPRVSRTVDHRPFPCPALARLR